jgi:8-demethyl-8-(2-methoxy-alpha-L-rhamnosyl)tetracenomycin-C 3'-O-methyltransferase
MTTTLDELGVHHGTDKSTLDHGYTLFYDKLFGPLRHEPVQLLELGVYAGASLGMWNDYFTNPDSDIIGIDCGILDDLPAFGPRVRAYRSDQTEIPLQLQGNISFDIIIDDASHISSKTIASFITWWPKLKRGGIYVVEDIVTSYYIDSVESSANPEKPVRNPYGRTAMQWFRRLADQVNMGDIPSRYHVGDYDLASITFRPNMVIVEKAKCASMWRHSPRRR